MIEKLSFHLASKIISTDKSQEYSSDDIEVIKYGIECIINTGIPIVFYLFFSFSMGIFPEFLLWLITFLTIRNCIGGYHASSHWKCIIFSIAFGIFSLYVIQAYSSLRLCFKLILMVLVLCTHIIFAPIMNAEEITNTLLKQKLRIKTITFLSLVTIATIILHNTYPSSSNALFIGILSAEILYIIEKIKQLIQK